MDKDMGKRAWRFTVTSAQDSQLGSGPHRLPRSSSLGSSHQRAMRWLSALQRMMPVALMPCR